MHQTPVPGQESRKSTFREDLRDIFMNTQSLFSISKTLPPRLQNETDSIYILGQKFNLEQEKDPRTGDWFKFTHVILIFEELCHNFAQKILPDLEFMLFSDGIIFINQIYEKVTGYSGCSLCREAVFDNKFRDKLCENCRKFQKSLFLTICLMPSPTHLRVEDMDCISELLSSRFSVGMMGGKPGRAKFFVGSKERDFLCKDPHYVQDAVIGFNDISSFFCHEIKYVDVRKMSSSLAFGFYLKDEREFEEFEGFLRKGKEKLGEKWLLGFEEEFYQEKEFQEMMMQEEEKKWEEREEVEEKEDGNLIILERKKSKGKNECLVTN